MIVAAAKVTVRSPCYANKSRGQLRSQLDALVPSALKIEELEDEFERELMADGILGDVKPLPDYDLEFHAYRPVTVTGKPVSETIIEERR
jgi:hypothetical protein